MSHIEICEYELLHYLTEYMCNFFLLDHCGLCYVKSERQGQTAIP